MCLHMVVTCQGFPVPKFPGSSGTDGVTATFLQSSSEKSSNTRNRFIGELPTQIFFILWRIHLRRKKQRIIIININRESRYCESVELVLLRWSALALGKAIERLTQQFKQGINHTNTWIVLISQRLSVKEHCRGRAWVTNIPNCPLPKGKDRVLLVSNSVFTFAAEMVTPPPPPPVKSFSLPTTSPESLSSHSSGCANLSLSAFLFRRTNLFLFSIFCCFVN